MVFKSYAKAGFTSDLLPILPPDAQISTFSHHPEHVRQSRGKVPGKRVSDGWVGFGDWPNYTATDMDIELWETWNAGIGLQGRNVIGIDNDVSNPELADELEYIQTGTLGLAPVRHGNGARRLSTYRLAGAAKERVAFTLPIGAGGADAGGADDWLRDEAGDAGQGLGQGREIHAIELLGAGQQYVVEGIHPKTLKPYVWRNGESPATIGYANLPLITTPEKDLFITRCKAAIERRGGVILTASRASNARASHADVGLYAPSLKAIERALAAIPNTVDYDTWLKVCVAVKAAGGEAGYPAWEDWSLGWAENTPEVCRDKWDSFRPPFKLGWPYLSALAGEHGFSGAREDFGLGAKPDPEPETKATDDEAERQRARRSADMFGRSVFVEKLETAFDLASLELRSKLQFNAQWYGVGNPASNTKSAWAVFMANGAERRNVKSITYRPTGPLFIDEPGIGMCVNIWRKPEVKLPTGPVTEEQIERWLFHVRLLVPELINRDAMLDYFAAIGQRQDLKPNFALCLGSEHQGVGKSILLEPLRYLLGNHNVREIGPEEISSPYNGWAAETKLLIVEEMHSFNRKETMNRLKSLVATPPWRLYVNPKFGRPFEVPNLLAAVFFTNHPDALQLELNDRRFFVLWTPIEPQPEAYYTELMDWYRNGGVELVAAWLMQRDISHFNMQGRAPATVAKEDMRRMTRTLIDEWIEDGIENETSPFNADLVAVSDVWGAIPQGVVQSSHRPTHHRIAAALARAGAKRLGRVTLGEEKLTIYAIRNARNYTGLSMEMLAVRVAKMRADPNNDHRGSRHGSAA